MIQTLRNAEPVKIARRFLDTDRQAGQVSGSSGFRNPQCLQSPVSNLERIDIPANLSQSSDLFKSEQDGIPVEEEKPKKQQSHI